VIDIIYSAWNFFSKYGFCTFWAFCETKGAKSQKTRFLQSSERELSTFSALSEFDRAENAESSYKCKSVWFLWILWRLT